MNALIPDGAPALENEDMDSCVVCREPIRSGAKVCNHCKRSQNWTRHLLRWSTVAGAIVAVLSLVSTAISLRELIASPSDLKVIPLACGNESVELAVSNLGDKPGLIRQVALQIMANGSVLDKEVLLTAKQGDKIVKPHETQKIVYVMLVSDSPGPFPIPPVGIDTCTFVISVQTVDFEGNELKQKANCPCPQI